MRVCGDNSQKALVQRKKRRARGGVLAHNLRSRRLLVLGRGAIRSQSMSDIHQAEADIARRELLAFWAFIAFLAIGVGALGIDAFVLYA